MNKYIKTQIEYMLMTLKNFDTACQLAALEDDGKIDRTERKQLDQLKKVTEKYRKELEKVIK